MNIQKLYQTYGKNLYVRAAAAVFVVFIIAIIIRSGQSTETASVEETVPSVKVATAASLSNAGQISVIGTVRAFSEAFITTERSGRVTSVTAELGGTVGAGQVIATLENAAEQAAVLQAQGAYEAALAAAAQNAVGTDEAQTALTASQNNAINAVRSSYNTVNGAIRNSVDVYFGNPNASIPGLKIDGSGSTSFLNSERVAFQTILTDWQTRSNTLSTTGNIEAELAYARTQTDRTITLVDTFISLFNQPGGSGGYTEAELQAASANFTALRSSLLATRGTIDAATAGLASARDAVRRAELNASGGTVSASDAQVKQALGSLRAAQANLAKTILRTPIGGTVNSLDIKVGDFIGAFETVSVIANNNALEIVTYVGDAEKEQLVVGDKVMIENQFEGIITQIAPAVDEQTRKTEVRIATDNTNITNGDTVRITKDTATSTASTQIFIPITALKFEAENGSIFTVVDGTLTAQPVKIGAIRGSQVEITDGLSATDEFVVDVRGLVAGAKVQITN